MRKNDKEIETKREREITSSSLVTKMPFSNFLQSLQAQAQEAKVFIRATGEKLHKFSVDMENEINMAMENADDNITEKGDQVLFEQSKETKDTIAKEVREEPENRSGNPKTKPRLSRHSDVLDDDILPWRTRNERTKIEMLANVN
jgi:hypothetical protein